VVTVPTEEIEKMGLDSGSDLTWSYSNNSLVLKPKENEKEEDEK
jgi:antitoxin component of MazEF toxin-antitoxin module